MKKIFIALTVLAVIIAGIFTFALFQANSIIGELKPTLEQQVSTALKSDFSIEKIDFKPFPTFLKLHNLKLVDKNDPSKSLSVDSGSLKVGLLSLLSGKLDISAFKMKKPEITIRQTENGFLIDGMPAGNAKAKGKKGKGEKKKKKKEATPPKEKKQQAPIPDWLTVEIRKIALTNGLISFIPLEGKPVTVSQIELSSGIELSSDLVKLPSLKLSTDIENVGRIKTSVKDFSFGLKDQMVSFPNATLSNGEGEIVASGKYALQTNTGNIDFSLNRVAYHGEEVNGSGKLIAENGNFSLTETAIKGFNGEIKPQGEVSPFSPKIPFKGDLSITDLEIGRLLKLAKPEAPAPLTGTLVTLEVKASGATKPSVPKTLIAGGKMKLVDGEFPGGNLPALVLQSVRDIPLLNKALLSDVPEEYQDDLEGDSTAIKNLECTFSAKEERIIAQSLFLQSDIFSLEAKGSIGFDTTLDLDTTFRFIPAFSLAIAGKVKELGGLIDDNDQLVIPLTIKGSASDPKILPNMEEIMKLGAGDAIKEKASELLGKVLGSKKKDGDDGEPSDEDKLVEGVGNLFGF